MAIGQSPPYDRVEHAYAHFTSADKLTRGYDPWDSRKDDEWVLVYFPTTFKATLYPTLESVSRYYNWCIYRHHVYLDAEQLNASVTTSHLRELHVKLTSQEAPEVNGLELSKLCWKLLQETAFRETRSRHQAGSGGDRDKYTIDVEKLRSPEAAETIAKLPKQARIIAQALGEAAVVKYSELDLNAFARGLLVSGKLKTRQDPFRVVAYYAPTLAQCGFMEYPTRRVSEDEVLGDEE